MSDWNSVVDAVRQARSAAGSPPWSLATILCARAIDAVESGTLEAQGTNLAYRGAEAPGPYEVQDALGVPGVRVQNIVLAGGGNTGTVDVGDGQFPAVLRSRFIVKDAPAVFGALPAQLAAELDNLWKKIGASTNYWSSNQISRIRTVVQTGVPVVPSGAKDNGQPPGLTGDNVAGFQQLVGKFASFIALYSRAKIAEAAADAAATEADQSFWDSVTFWKSKTPPVPNSGSSGDLFTDWWNGVKDFLGGLFKNVFYTVLIIGAIVGAGYLCWVNRNAIGKWFGKQFGKVAASKGDGKVGP